MGWGALIGGLVSGIGSAVAGATSSSGGSQVNRNATEAGHQIYVAKNKYIDPFTGSDYWNLDLGKALQQSITTGETLAPGINAFNQAQLSQMLGGVIPGYQGMVSQMGRNVSSELAGQIPADVQNQIQRFSAQQGITSGIGGGGGAGGAAGAPFQLGVKDVTARDLGLTSLSMMQQGQAGLGNLLGLAKSYLMPQPVNPLSLLPFQDIIAGQQYTQQATFDANLAAFNASVMGSTTGLLGQVPTQSGVTGLTSGIGGLLQGLGQKNPNTGQSGYGLISSLFGGGGGGSSMDAFLGGAGGSSETLTGFSGLPISGFG